MSELPETQASLIARVKDPADAAAWTEFLALYRPVVYRMARAKGLQDSDAEDLAQRVFVSVSHAIGNWQPTADGPPFRAWLFRITRNAILNALSRTRPDQPAGSTSVWDLLHDYPVPADESSATFLKESRREAFRWAAEEIRPEFSEVTWNLFWQTSVLGKSAEEVAKEHGRTTGAVYMARYRVMQRLKEKVSQATSSWEL